MEIIWDSSNVSKNHPKWHDTSGDGINRFPLKWYMSIGCRGTFTLCVLSVTVSWVLKHVGRRPPPQPFEYISWIELAKDTFRFKLNDIFVERHGRPLTESDQIFNGHFISSTGYILCEQAAIQERKRMFEPVEIWVSESNIKIWCEMIRKNDGDRHKIGLENVFNK